MQIKTLFLLFENTSGEEKKSFGTIRSEKVVTLLTLAPSSPETSFTNRSELDIAKAEKNLLSLSGSLYVNLPKKVCTHSENDAIKSGANVRLER